VADQPALYCYDGSDGAKRALHLASGLIPGAPAVVLAIWQSAMVGALSAPYAVASVDAIEQADAAARQRAAELSSEGCRLLAGAAGIPEPRTAESLGSVWRTVLDSAEAVDARVIVLGSRGLGAISSAILGSVSHGVANHSHRPVLIVPGPGA